MKIDYDNNPEILNNFLNYLLGIKGYSFNTIISYNSDLMQFFRFIKTYLNIPNEIKDFNTFVLLQVKKSDIIAFMVYLNFHRDNSPSTRYRRLISIRVFYKWLLNTDPAIEKENPANDIINIPKIERLPKYLSLEQSKKIQTIFTLKNSNFPERNNAIISLFLSTGIRLSELININLCDVDLKNKTIKINNGKGGKDRLVFINEFCKKQIEKYLEIRNNNKTTIDFKEALFLNRQNKRVGVDCIENICKKAFELIGASNNSYTPHTLRHTAASLIYIYVTQDVFVLKKLLGHSTISSTQIYTHIHDKTLKEAVDNNPLNKVA